MARRILTIELRNPEWLNAGRIPLAIDHWLEIHWMPYLINDRWTGELESHAPGFEVTRLGGNPQSEIDVYGVLVDPSEIAWLESALQNGPANPRVKYLARVNEIEAPQYGMPTHAKIEVSTGSDADALFAVRRRAQVVKFLKYHWWKIGAAVMIAYWWFI